MAIKLYGSPLFTCTQRVIACLLEKDIEYELVPINLQAGEHKQPSYLAKNPFGQTPVLEDGDLTLFESRAINAYLSNKYKDQGTDLMRHGNHKEIGLVGNWIEVESQHYNPVITPIVFQLLLNPMFGKPTDEAVVDENVEKFEKILDIYEARLTDNKYLAGDFFSLADLNHFPYTNAFMKTRCASLINFSDMIKSSRSQNESSMMYNLEENVSGSRFVGNTPSQKVVPTHHLRSYLPRRRLNGISLRNHFPGRDSADHESSTHPHVEKCSNME